jgi:vacuolar-type H+-ATPase subunit H
MKEADNIIRKARAESDEIRSASGGAPEETSREGVNSLLKEAEKEAKELMANARMEELELRGEISKLQAQKERFLVEYRELLEKHLRFLTEEV